MSRWTRDYSTGETICAVCGAPKGGRVSCCRTAPHVSFDSFCAKYFPGAVIGVDVPCSTAREFWDDYLTSDSRSLASYIADTTRSVEA